MTYITLDEAKTHLRVDFADDDTYITALVNLVEELVLTEVKGSIAGEGTVETVGTTALVGIDTNFLDFIVGNTITVYDETVRTIATITDNENLTVSAALTNTDSGLTYIMHRGLPDVDGVIPLGLEQAMLILISHFYTNREPVLIGVGLTEMPLSFKWLVAPYKNWTIS